jgi:hypothetical protein
LFPDSPKEWYTGMIYGFGSCQTFDGTKYDCNAFGQYLVTSVKFGISQELKIFALRVNKH